MTPSDEVPQQEPFGLNPAHDLRFRSRRSAITVSPGLVGERSRPQWVRAVILHGNEATQDRTDEADEDHLQRMTDL